MPEGTPPFVSNSFVALIPGFAMAILGIVLRLVFSATSYGSAFDFVYAVLQAPLTSLIGENIWSLIILNIIANLIFAFGIHSGFVTGMIAPILFGLDAMNQAAYAAGEPVPSIIGMAFSYITTVAVFYPAMAASALMARSERLKTVGEICIAPRDLWYLRAALCRGRGSTPHEGPMRRSLPKCQAHGRHPCLSLYLHARRERIVMQFLHTSDQRIVNEGGDEVQLVGYAMGNWMVQEAFLFGSGAFHADFKPFMRAQGMDRGRTIDQTIRETCGETYARSFWPRFWRAYLAEDDIAYLAELGMNSVRLPLAARAFLAEEPGLMWNEDAFEHLADVLGWCDVHDVYAILDLHAAVAGQSAIGCDDGWDNQPHLFTDEEGWERTICLWEELARRFGNRACIAGYELINEPLALPTWDGLWPELLRFYDECVARIRAIDARHIVFLQGGRFAHRSDMLRPNMDPANNWVCTYHIYETLPDLGLLGPILAERERLGVPIWVGETGGDAAYMAVLYEMLRAHGIGVNVWVEKAVWRPNAPTLLTYQTPEGFQEICDYAQKGGPKPSYARAQAIWDAYLEQVRFLACDRHPDMACAILRTPDVAVPAVGYDALPGPGFSFQGSYPWCTYCGYRREDPMDLVLADGDAPFEWSEFKGMAKVPKYGDFPRLALRLHRGDFACYTFRGCAANDLASAEVRSHGGGVLRMETALGALDCAVDGADWTPSGALRLGEGDVTVRLQCTSGTVDVRTVWARHDV